MADLKTPGVYLDKINTGSAPIEGTSTSVCAFMGKAPRGDIATGFVMISSWTDFVQKASFGCNDSVFRNDDFMAYNIYNFYQNGGGKAYFGVIKGTGAAKAKITLGTSDNIVTFTAKSAGTWANGITIIIKKNSLDDTLFDVVFQRNNGTSENPKVEVYEQYKALSNSTSAGTAYFVNALKSSDLVDVTIIGNGELAVSTGIILAGGTEGTFESDSAEDSALVGASGLIHKLDTLTDVSLIINGGETSETVLKGIIDYCSNRGDIYALLDAPNDSTVANIVSTRQKLSGLGEIHYPFVTMSDPVTGVNVEVPASGMLAGIYARFDASYGVWRAAAGTEAVLRGALGTVKTLTEAEYQTLFEAGVNCIIPKPNSGIVMYGARSLGQKYVSDDRLDIYVTKSIKNGTEWAVFELNDEKLWLRLRATILSFLDSLYQKGAFKGDGEGSAYYVTCDASLNTDANIERGIVTAEWGYATKKPAEFVVHRLNKITASSN